MNNVFNDNSLSGQYCNLDDFLEDLYEKILPMLKYARELKQEILKSYCTYSQMVTPSLSLSDILNSNRSAEITAIKSYLVDLSYQEPYWNDDIKTEISSRYNCTYNSEVPNCFTEAFERKGCLISFGQDCFYTEKLNIIKNGIVYDIPNSFDRNSYLKNLFLLGIIDENYYLENINIPINIKFCTVNNRRYTQECFEQNNLSRDDRIKVVEKILKLMSHIVNRTDPGLLCKSFDNGIWEFRNGVSDDRIIRIFYIYYSSGIVLLNGFIKKSQGTPEKELALARDLAKICQR